MSQCHTRVAAAVACWVFALVGGFAGARPAAGEDFRIENKVFSEGRKEPVSRSTTIFHGGVVYDFMQDLGEVIVFDKPHGRFVLLDTRRGVRTELTTAEVAAFTQRLKQWADAQQDPYVRFLAAPKFDSPLDESSGKLVLSSTWMTYRIEPADAESRDVSTQYREFSDWLTRLNSLLNPGSRLPFGRLVANELLAERGAMPREVELTTTPKRGSSGKQTTVRSEHQLGHRLSAADLNRVALARQSMDSFKQVSFEAYRKGEAR